MKSRFNDTAAALLPGHVINRIFKIFKGWKMTNALTLPRRQHYNKSNAPNMIVRTCALFTKLISQLDLNDSRDVSWGGVQGRKRFPLTLDQTP